MAPRQPDGDIAAAETGAIAIASAIAPMSAAYVIVTIVRAISSWSRIMKNAIAITSTGATVFTMRPCGRLAHGALDQGDHAASDRACDDEDRKKPASTFGMYDQTERTRSSSATITKHVDRDRECAQKDNPEGDRSKKRAEGAANDAHYYVAAARSALEHPDLAQHAARHE